MHDDGDLAQFAEKEEKRIADYRTVFTTPEGRRVLEDLEERFLWQESRNFILDKNPLALAYIDGQRNVLKSIRKWLTLDLNSYIQQLKKPVDPLGGDPYGQSTGGYH
jgi:anti-sigma-K factor RskA